MFGQAKLGVFVIQVSRQQPCLAGAQQVTSPKQQRGHHRDVYIIPVESVAKLRPVQVPSRQRILTNNVMTIVILGLSQWTIDQVSHCVVHF